MQLVIFAIFISSTVTGLSRYRTWYTAKSKVSSQASRSQDDDYSKYHSTFEESPGNFSPEFPFIT